MAPVVEQLAAEYAGKVKIVGMDIDKNQGAASKLGIMSIPAVVFFKKGKESGRIVGGSKQTLKTELDKLLS